MRTFCERAVTLFILAALACWSLAPSESLADSPARLFMLGVLAMLLLVMLALEGLSRTSVPREMDFLPLSDDATLGRLRASAAGLLAAAFEEGPARRVSLTPGTPMSALPLISADGSAWALVMEDARQRQTLIEVLTAFEGGLRFSTLDHRLAGASPRPRHALMQIKHGADAATLWAAHERTLQQLTAAGLKPERAEPGAFEELLRRTSQETLEHFRARPLSAPAITVWRLLFAASPHERPLLSQRVAVRALKARDVDVEHEDKGGARGAPVGLGPGWMPKAPSRKVLGGLAVSAALATSVALQLSWDLVGTMGWDQVPATIESADLASGTKGTETHIWYTLSCRYSYVVDGKRYRGQHCTLRDESMPRRGDARGKLARLTEHVSSGDPWPAWVDPKDPSAAVLFRPVGVLAIPAGLLAFWLTLTAALKGFAALLWYLHHRPR